MATVKYFEDLEIWKMASNLDTEIFEITSAGKISTDFELRNALRKTTGSVMDNIAEGFEINGNKELLRFLHITKGSAGEVRSQIHRAYNRKYFSSQIHAEYIGKCKILSEKIYNFISYLQKSDLTGIKFKHREKNANKSSTKV